MLLRFKFWFIVLSLYCQAFASPIDSEKVQELKDYNGTTIIKDGKSESVVEDIKKGTENSTESLENDKASVNSDKSNLETEMKRTARSFIQLENKVGIEDMKRIAEYFMKGGPLSGSPCLQSYNYEKPICECKEPIVGAGRENVWCPATLLGLPHFVPGQHSSYPLSDSKLRMAHKSQSSGDIARDVELISDFPLKNIQNVDEVSQQKSNSCNCNNAPMKLQDFNSSLKKKTSQKIKTPKKSNLVAALKSNYVKEVPNNKACLPIHPAFMHPGVINFHPVPETSQAIYALHDQVSQILAKIQSQISPQQQDLKALQSNVQFEKLQNNFDISSEKDLQMEESNYKIDTSSLKKLLRSIMAVLSRFSLIPLEEQSLISKSENQIAPHHYPRLPINLPAQQIGHNLPHPLLTHFKKKCICSPQFVINPHEDDLTVPQNNINISENDSIKLNDSEFDQNIPQTDINTYPIGHSHFPISRPLQHVPCNCLLKSKFQNTHHGLKIPLIGAPHLIFKNHCPCINSFKSKIENIFQKFPREVNEKMEEIPKSHDVPEVIESVIEELIKKHLSKRS